MVVKGLRGDCPPPGNFVRGIFHSTCSKGTLTPLEIFLMGECFGVPVSHLKINKSNVIKKLGAVFIFIVAIMNSVKNN